jgi:hypothetical protein
MRDTANEASPSAAFQKSRLRDLEPQCCYWQGRSCLRTNACQTRHRLWTNHCELSSHPSARQDLGVAQAQARMKACSFSYNPVCCSSSKGRVRFFQGGPNRSISTFRPRSMYNLRDALAAGVERYPYQYHNRHLGAFRAAHGQL